MYSVIVSSSRLLLLPQFYKLAHLEPLKKLKTGFSGRNEKIKLKKEKVEGERGREKRNTNLLKMLYELLGAPDQRDLKEGMVQLSGRKWQGTQKTRA